MFERKARTLASNIRVGRGALEMVRGMLADAIGQPCPYCRRPLELGTVALDHRSPLRSSAARRSAILRCQYFDRPENLALVCQGCNALKSDLEPGDFRALLSFMAANPAIGANLRRRLGHERQWWTLRKRKGPGAPLSHGQQAGGGIPQPGPPRAR